MGKNACKKMHFRFYGITRLIEQRIKKFGKNYMSLNLKIIYKSMKMNRNFE